MGLSLLGASLLHFCGLESLYICNHIGLRGGASYTNAIHTRWNRGMNSSLARVLLCTENIIWYVYNRTAVFYASFYDG